MDNVCGAKFIMYNVLPYNNINKFNKYLITIL